MHNCEQDALGDILPAIPLYEKSHNQDNRAMQRAQGTTPGRQQNGDQGGWQQAVLILTMSAKNSTLVIIRARPKG